MSTRAQIGIYADNNIKTEPVVIIYRHCDGYPTGDGAVMPELIQYVSELVEVQGGYDAESIAAELLYKFIDAYGTSNGGYGIGRQLRDGIRFYYTVMPEGVTVYDARVMSTLKMLPKPMFHTAWVEPERVRTLEKELAELADALGKKQVELRGLKSKQFSKRG